MNSSQFFTGKYRADCTISGVASPSQPTLFYGYYAIYDVSVADQPEHIFTRPTNCSRTDHKEALHDAETEAQEEIRKLIINDLRREKH